jgi:dipeptidyl aminopeptidase/acylaminoacyl peptidase
MVDGRAVVVRDGGVVVLAGGARSVLFQAPPGGNAKDPIWSPDGTEVAFTYVPPRVSPGSADQLFVSDVVVVGADGARPRVAVPHGAPGTIVEMPAWAPDAAALYFAYYSPVYRDGRLVDQTVEVRRRDLVSGATRAVASGGSGPGVSPDGKTVVYVVEGGPGPSLRMVDADGCGGGEFAARQAARS